MSTSPPTSRSSSWCVIPNPFLPALYPSLSVLSSPRSVRFSCRSKSACPTLTPFLPALCPSLALLCLVSAFRLKFNVRSGTQHDHELVRMCENYGFCIKTRFFASKTRSFVSKPRDFKFQMMIFTGVASAAASPARTMQVRFITEDERDGFHANNGGLCTGYTTP